MFGIREISDPQQRSAACARLTGLLPDWFGLPEANARYFAGLAGLTCLGAFTDGGECIGMAALRLHFGTTLEIWWMGVDPAFHRQGIGRALMDAAADHARHSGCRDMVLMTLGEESDDAGYAATRKFYLAQGFRPLMPEHMAHGDDPLVWMIRNLRH